MPNFPVLDAPRNEDNDPGRIAFENFGNIEPYIPEIDFWTAMPVRLVHTLDGLCIELGPYTLDCRDIDKLRAAIRGYDSAITGR